MRTSSDKLIHERGHASPGNLKSLRNNCYTEKNGHEIFMIDFGAEKPSDGAVCL